MPQFLAVCVNPTFQRTIILEDLHTGEVNRGSATRFDIAGKGVNTARVLHQLGSSVRQLTHLGSGREELLALCSAEGLDIAWEPSESRIRTCITLLDEAAKETTEIIEPTEAVDGATVKRIRKRYLHEIEAAEWVVLSGSKAPGYPTDLFADFILAAKRRGLKTVVDFRGNELLAAMESGISVVKINLVEFVTTFLPGLPVSETDDSAALAAAREKMQELSRAGCDFVITRGAKDVLFASQGRAGSFTPPRINRVVNTVGSGDAFCGGLVHALANGSSLEDAAREGARCGGLNAALLKPGTIIDC